MRYFEASMLYNADTLKRMGKMQSHSRVIHNSVYLIMCVILIIAGLYFGARTPIGLLCIAAGGIGIPLMGSVIKTRTDNIIRTLGNNTIRVDYKFDEYGITAATSGQKNRFRYSDFIKLWKDTDYYYLFYGKIDVLMVPGKSLDPNEPAEFEKLISEMSGLTWYNYISPLMLDIRLFADELKRALRK